MAVVESVKPVRSAWSHPCRSTASGRHGYRIDSCDPALLAYLHSCLAFSRRESLRVIYCDQWRHYLFDEVFSDGSTRGLVGRVRPLFERALALGAGGLLLAHNHPSGNCRPSAADIRSTALLRDLGAALEVELIDHLIFARGRCFSMAGGGYL
ncbi:MAG: hypothetical protein B7X57_00370 [Erythrobacter sp. 34-65-8]|nr:MAG: hypothetical protein B7X57_00370 [Erythrobacter sp. 34-65-8]